MRLVFMGTPDFAVPALDALIAAGHELAAVYCQPPRPAGRGKSLRASPVQQRAELLDLPVRHPLTLRDSEEQARFATLGVDAAVVAAYGLILPKPILAAPRLGCFNIHASLLPRWRGAAPIQRAILAGDDVTGVTIMDMEAGLDTGPMRATVEIPVKRNTAGELTSELAQAGAALMVAVLGDLTRYPARPQPEDGVTYAAKLEKHEARLAFAVGAIAAERQVRAFNPAPGAFFELRGERVRVLAAEVEPAAGQAGAVLDDALLIGCGADALRPTRVQRAGRGVMSSAGAAPRFPDPARHAVVTRYALTLEYDGRPFMGWQRQDHGPSVQAALEHAVEKMTGERAVLHAAGRTDAGVHALAMRAHVQLRGEVTPFRLAEGLNALVRPDPIAVLDCETVADDWHARFSCVGRSYEYRIANRRAPLTVEAGLAWRVPAPLDATTMHEAAQALVGRHDFTTFRSAHCQSDSPVKTLDWLDVTREGDRVVIRAEARSFLHHQVRSMVGCLALVGQGKWSVADLAAALAAQDRAALGYNAPPDGLYFTGARYS